jgi:hypothetical protein
MPVSPSTGEADTGGSWFEASPDLKKSHQDLISNDKHDVVVHIIILAMWRYW